MPLMTTDSFCRERGGVGAVREIKYEKEIGIFAFVETLFFKVIR
jgi:hypothetical protein